MATIKKLKLKLLSGLLSNEIQSDTVFGHFAWRFKDIHGEEKLLEFLDYFKKGEPIFTVSDGMFENGNEIYFPKPLKLTPPKFKSDSKKERIKNFIKQKEAKSNKLITLSELNLYLNGELDKFDELISNGNRDKAPGLKSDLRVSVEIDRDTYKSKEGRLFSYHPKYLDNNTFIVLFVKILNQSKWDELYCENILKSVFEIGYGKKKSSGYGQFEVIGDLEDFNGFYEPEKSNGFISLSHYLPSNDDKIVEAFYDINVKYGKLGEEYSASQNPFKPVMLLLKPGSCFLTNTKKDFYGRVIDKIIDYKPSIIHSAIAFTLNTIL